MITVSEVGTPSTKNGAADCAGQRPAETQAGEPESFPHQPSEGSERAGRALSVLAFLGAIAGLYFGRPILMPIVVSLLLAFLFAPIVTGLTRVGMPRWLGSAVVVLGLLGLLGGGAYLLQGPVDRWLEEAPQALARAEVRLREFLAPVEQVGAAADQVEEIANGGEEAETVRVEAAGGFKSAVFDRTRGAVAGGVVVLGLLYFLLSWGHLFKLKLGRVLSTKEERRHAWRLARTVQQDISTYLLTVTGINILLGTAVTAAMALMGMPSPLLWGVMAAVLNFIPYFGAIIGMAILGIVGFAVFEAPGTAVLVALVYLLLTGLEGNVLKPMILGQRLRLNPVALFVGLLFWGWIWGIVGAIVAVPLLSVLKLWSDHYRPLAPVATFLGR